jgi:hypothetical protein
MAKSPEGPKRIRIIVLSDDGKESLAETTFKLDEVVLGEGIKWLNSWIPRLPIDSAKPNIKCEIL